MKASFWITPVVVMTIQRNATSWGREELLSLLSTSGALAGLCITVVALMNTFDKTRAGVSVVDDMLAVCAAAFLLCIYLIFWALRSHKVSRFEALIRVVDGVFLLAMTIMTFAAFIMIYTIWYPRDERLSGSSVHGPIFLSRKRSMHTLAGLNRYLERFTRASILALVACGVGIVG